MANRPIVSIIGPRQRDIVGLLGSNLAGVTFVDQAGGESDTMEMRVRVSMPAPAGPTTGARYVASVGWSASAMRVKGVYTVQTSTLSGDAEAGYERVIQCRACDFLDKLKQVDSENFDDMTAGDIFSKIAAQAGTTAIVDPELAKIKLPYRLRWKQQAGDFVEELAQELGGTLKLAGGLMAVLKRGSGRSASGAALAPIIVPFSEDYGFSITIEQRGLYAEADGGWFDMNSGIEQMAKGKGLGVLSRVLPIHIFPTEEQAGIAANAYGREEGRKSVSGSFDMAGNPIATAEAPVVPVGYGPDIDGADLVASVVTDEITFDDDGGWVTTVEVQQREQSKSKKAGGGGGSAGATGDYSLWDEAAGGAASGP